MTMVSQDSSSNESTSIMLHQYSFSDMAAGPTSFADHSCITNWDGQSSNVLPSIQSLGEKICRSMDLVQASVPEDSEIRQRHLMNIRAGKESNHQDFSSALGKGLSLSLHSHLPSDSSIPSSYYSEAEPIVNQIDPGYLTAREEPRVHINAYASLSSMPQNHPWSVSSIELLPSLTIQNSRYLKPAQSLLEEVISVIKSVELKPDKQLRKDKSERRMLQDGTITLGGCTKAGRMMNNQARNALGSNEHSFADNHDIQIRIAKLDALLEEVNSRHERYRHQMEEVVSSFEAVAGFGSAKSYTCLALQAMSRHFCSLRSAIVMQICAARRCLSEDSPSNLGDHSQLSLFDQNAKQERASLQHLGMISIQQSWRPLRGLPENAVSILRAWLFEHFLHPYPNDSEKIMLAAQTGLTRNQVSNWFINARVRLWKPMIEEMYREEIQEASVGSTTSTDNTSRTRDGMSQIM